MYKTKYKRKLTAILSADVVGYSRLMGDDEESTIQTLNSYRDIMTTLIEQHQGSVVDAVGDNLLAEFTSAVDAVQCAVAIQIKLKKQNDKLIVSRHMLFRIGINIGDVIQEKDRIYGDGVNRAARIESISEPGGVCISRNVYDHVKEKLNFGYQYIGEHAVKNIKDPVRVYNVLMDPKDAGKLIIEKSKPILTIWVWSTIVVTAVLLTFIGYQVFQKITGPDFEPASTENMAYLLPDKPSITVLPFDNISEDKNQEYIAVGLTDNIITTLSKMHNLFVIARNSSSIYKGRPVKVQQVSEELGVRYVLEGSVQRSGDQVRVIAQLIDAIDGKHLWSERYNRHFKDIFELIDEITSKIANSLRIELVLGEGGKLWNKNRPSNLQFNEKLFEAGSYVVQFNKEANIKAKQLYKEVINLEPGYYAGYLMLGLTHLMDVYLVQSSSPAESLGNAMKLCNKAIELDETQDGPHWVLGDIYTLSRKYDKAIAECELALALNSNSVPAYQALGRALTYSGRPKEAIEVLTKASRLNPVNLSNPELGYAYLEVGKYQEALAEFKKAIKKNPKNIIAWSGLTITYALTGRYEETRKAWSEVLKIDTNTSVEKLLKILPATADSLKRTLAAFNKAGIPEYPSVDIMEKPSIAVLPFTNMSTDPEQEHFCDGMTENLISVFAQTQQLLVIARNSTFAYKDKSIDVRQIGQELGARYVVEGSIQKSGDRFRFVVQLIDTGTGLHIWAERYDREFKDIFDLQDEITLEILTAVGVKLFAEIELNPGIIEGIADIQSFIMLTKLYEYYYNPKRERYAWALKNAKEIITKNPEYPYRYDWLSSVYMVGAMTGSCESISICLFKAADAIKKSFSLDANNWLAHRQSGNLFTMRKEHDKAILSFKKAIELNPNSADSYFGIGRVLNYSDKPEEALEYLNKAIRLNPALPNLYLFNLGVSYNLLGQYKKAIEMYKKILKRQPTLWYPYLGLAAAYSDSGQINNAKTAVKELLYLLPDYSIEFFKKTSMYKTQDQLDRIVETLRKAGLPEK